jgi:hypothetical protein
MSMVVVLPMARASGMMVIITCSRLLEGGE